MHDGLLSSSGGHWVGLECFRSWSGRDLQPMLGYRQWRRFEQAIERAITSCNASRNNPEYHFAGAGKMIEVGKDGIRDVHAYPSPAFPAISSPRTATRRSISALVGLLQH